MADGGPGKDRAAQSAGGDPPAPAGVAAGLTAGGAVLGGDAGRAGGKEPAGPVPDRLVRDAAGVSHGRPGGTLRVDPAPVRQRRAPGGGRHWGAGQFVVTVSGAVAAWAVIAGACLCVGSRGVEWPTGETFDFRWQMVLLSSLVGAALAAAGVAYQAVLRNPLAEPYLLGVSSGASLAAYLWPLPVLGPARRAAGLPRAQQLCAFAGALGAAASPVP